MTLKTLGRNVLVLFVTVLGLAQAHAGASFLYASVHHDLSIQLYPSEQRLVGRDVIAWDLKQAHAFPLFLNPQAKITRITSKGKDVPHTFDGGRLVLQMGRLEDLADGEVTISYEARFSDEVPEDPVYTEDPTYGVAAVILEQGSLLLSGAAWYPQVAEGKSSFLIRVDGPAGYEAITDGKRLMRRNEGGKSISTWQIGPTLRGVSLSAGPYVVRESSVLGIPIYSYFFPEDDHLAQRYLDAVAEYLRLYSGLFGPYPFEKYAVVENFFPTGYGFPSYTLLGRRVIRLGFIVETSLGHEVAHAWWGNGVLADYEQGNWSEAITAYVADHFFKERASSEQGRLHRLKLLRDFATLVPREEDFPLRAFTSRYNPATRAVGYGKGAMVFHMARRLVGEEAFWGGLKDVFAQKCFERASWDDFAEAWERRTKQDMKSFFTQWVSRTGGPSLSFEQIESDKQGQAWIVTGLLVQEKPYFQIQMPLRLETEGPPVETYVPIDGKASPFTIRSLSRPRRLVGDPDVDLFRILHPSELPPTVNGIKASTSLVAVTAHTLPETSQKALRTLLMSLGQERAPVLAEDQKEGIDLGKTDILYAGLPANPAFLPPLSEELSFSSKGFTLKGRTFDQRGDVLFAVIRHGHRSDKVVALLLFLSQEGLSAAVRKIPHYGNYSYLAFREGVNQDKGTWSVTASPLIFAFPLKEVSP
ncbi:MAG: M1 family aminopeptidase [Thermodesulfobacteriota bacterium]|nr:M1 family aminopeptidase [Thermodesulfobacteriota bacterium]